MFRISIKLTESLRQLNDAVEKGAYKTIRHAGFSIAKDAKESMRYAKGPSPPGTPPHVHHGRLQKSIWMSQDDDGVVVGPAYSRVKIGGRPAWLGQMLERGGTFQHKRKTRGRPKKGAPPPPTITYPARPFMAPALQRNLARFHRDWENALSY